MKREKLPSTDGWKSCSEKLKDPRWQKVRLQILERDKWTCRLCKSTENTLHVHHTAYRRGHDPWDYEPVTLITLCEECHDLLEDFRSELLRWTAFFDGTDWRQLFGFVLGLAFMHERCRAQCNVRSIPSVPVLARGYLMARCGEGLLNRLFCLSDRESYEKGWLDDLADQYNEALSNLEVDAFLLKEVIRHGPTRTTSKVSQECGAGRQSEASADTAES